MEGKKIITVIMAGALTAAFSTSAFAGNWIKNSAGWQYDQSGNGSFAKNEWLWIDGNQDGIAECYYFDGTGFMWHDREKDGYTINSEGQWTVGGAVQTKRVKTDNDKTTGQQIDFHAITVNEDTASGYTAEGLFDPAFKFHEYSRYDKLSNNNMTVLRYKMGTPYSIYYSFKGNEDNGSFLRPEEERAVQEATWKFLSEHITEGMSDLEKEEVIINYMTGKLEYGYSDHASDIYGGLVTGTVTCGGYADTFAWLCNAVGLNVLYVSGEAEGRAGLPPQHAWNLVELDGKWYQVDMTFEDGAGKKGKYINLTDTEMGKDHTWKQNGLPVCN